MTDKDRNTLKTWILDFEFHEVNDGTDADVRIVVGTGRPDVSFADEVDTDAFCAHDAKWLVETLVDVFADVFTVEMDDLRWNYGTDSYGGRTIEISAGVGLSDGSGEY